MGEPMSKIWMLAFLCLSIGLSAQTIAILETVAEPGVKLAEADLLLWTDEFRSLAFQELSHKKSYQILTRDNLHNLVRQVLQSGVELDGDFGVNLPKTGAVLRTDYVAQLRVAPRGVQYAVIGELYQVSRGELVGTFTVTVAQTADISAIVKKQVPQLCQRLLQVAAQAIPDEQLGIVGVSSDNSTGREGLLLLHITSEPSGAMISIDGRPLPSCTATPCQVQVTPGPHHIYAVLDAHADWEQKVEVRSAEQKIHANLSPNFGTLVLNPSLATSWDPAYLEMYVGDQRLDIGAYRLAPGVHQVKIMHPCAQTTTFKVGLKSGAMEMFDRNIPSRQAPLTMKAEQKGKAIKTPVWVDGKKVGNTPWSGQVPLCGEILVGPDKAKLDVRLNSQEPNIIVYEQP
jgi:hypothetical protein